MTSCYCKSNKAYLECCQPYHTNRIKPATAEQLMRSRYCAFVLALGDYLIETHASSTRSSVNKEELVSWANSVKWMKLEIIETLNGKENESTGIVEFKAHFKEKIFKRQIHERSNFIKENGEWRYLNGVHL